MAEFVTPWALWDTDLVLESDPMTDTAIAKFDLRGALRIHFATLPLGKNVEDMPLANDWDKARSATEYFHIIKRDLEHQQRVADHISNILLEVTELHNRQISKAKSLEDTSAAASPSGPMITGPGSAHPKVESRNLPNPLRMPPPTGISMLQVHNVARPPLTCRSIQTVLQCQKELAQTLKVLLECLESAMQIEESIVYESEDWNECGALLDQFSRFQKEADKLIRDVDKTSSNIQSVVESETSEIRKCLWNATMSNTNRALYFHELDASIYDWKKFSLGFMAHWVEMVGIGLLCMKDGKAA